jgi:hypothetical protein
MGGLDSIQTKRRGLKSANSHEITGVFEPENTY